MWISKRTLVTAFAAVAAAVSMAVAGGALAKHGNDDRGDHGGKGHGNGSALLESSLAPSLTTDPTFHGVAPGGAPWVLRRGDVEIKRSGRLELEVRGLVIPSPPGDGTAGPVETISASLFCGADADTAPADTSRQVPLSDSGNARIKDRSFDVPDECLAPVVLVHPNGDLTHYIAVDGQRR